MGDYEVVVNQNGSTVRFCCDTDYDALEIAEKIWEGLTEYDGRCSVTIARQEGVNND